MDKMLWCLEVSLKDIIQVGWGDRWGNYMYEDTDYMCVAVSRPVMSDSVTLWTVACQAPLSMEFSRKEYWSGLPFPPLEDLPNNRDQTQVSSIAGEFFTIWVTSKGHRWRIVCQILIVVEARWLGH